MNPLFESSTEVTPDILFVDCRHSLKDNDLGKRLYEDHHIPNAMFAHIEKDLSDPEKISKKTMNLKMGPTKMGPRRITKFSPG